MPIIRKLLTAPGMGPIRTAQVVAIVAVPDRFRTRQQFWSYCGLGIVTRSSADWRPGRKGGLERTQLPDDPLHAHYQRMIEKGIKPPLARLTVARRIAATVLSMWKNQEVYDSKRHAVVEQP